LAADRETGNGGGDLMSTLTMWSPWRELARAQEEQSRLLEDRFVFRAGESLGWTPATDIYEDEEGLTLKFELAGVEPKDVDIRFENGVLTIKGDRKLEKEEKKENYHRVELAYGAFNRSFSLPATVDAEKIAAESKLGVLVVRLPKKAEAKPKSIQVKVN
jgi:HSP20 family protein